MTDGWYDAPRENAHHPAGTQVAEPVIANGCWGISQRSTYKGLHPRARSCNLRRRHRRLTCVSHKHLEPLAHELKKQIESRPRLPKVTEADFAVPSPSEPTPGGEGAAA